MKRSDYDDILKSLSEPDKVADAIVLLNEKLTSDEADFNKLVDSNASLRDTNAKLALRITTPVEVEEPKQEVDLFEQLKIDINK